MNKLVFLDIDGVLNNAYTKERFQGFTGIDSRLASMFHRWCQKHQNVSVILSSTWRIEEAFKDEVKRNGIHFIDVTQRIPFKTSRGLEIQASLDFYKPPAYCILDDYSPTEFLKHQRPFLVQTSAAQGLQEKKLLAMDKILGTIV